jgi:hypothetical protein
MKLSTLVLAATLLALPAAGAFAQTTTPAQRHSIRARQTRQQARINHGVRDGQITPKGAAHAEANQARIASEQHNMRAADGGHLTAQDRHTLARQQDRTSKGIYDRNHNAATDPGVAPR